MGSEHSTQGQAHPGPQKQASLNLNSNRQSSANLRKQHTIAHPIASSDQSESIERPGSTSPGPSMCSDVDLPYISYTVNRPIGGEV